jgi:hypothetical protein
LKPRTWPQTKERGGTIAESIFCYSPLFCQIHPPADFSTSYTWSSENPLSQIPIRLTPKLEKSTWNPASYRIHPRNALRSIADTHESHPSLIGLGFIRFMRASPAWANFNFASLAILSVATYSANDDGHGDGIGLAIKDIQNLRDCWMEGFCLQKMFETRGGGSNNGKIWMGTA